MKVIQEKDIVKLVQGWPTKQSTYFDISPILSNPRMFSYVINQMEAYLKSRDFDFIATMESRGFLFASALAYKLNKGLILIRKKGKLPPPVISKSYQSNIFKKTIQMESKWKKKKVIIIDDILNSGEGLNSACLLLEKNKNKIDSIVVCLDIRSSNSNFNINSKILNYPLFSVFLRKQKKKEKITLSVG